MFKKELIDHLNYLHKRAFLVGRLWIPNNPSGPCVIWINDGKALNLTKKFSTMSNFLESSDPVGTLKKLNDLESLGNFDEILLNTPIEDRDIKKPWLLSPCDLQAIKASGVTFVSSMLERVIEEKAKGDLNAAKDIRKNILHLIGKNLSEIKPGTKAALKVKDLLIKQKLWSQYLEVGIGQDAEIFTKSQPMSSVGSGFEIGILEDSNWNNPEPEIVLVINSKNKIVGASLGNDVNLRDFEGRSALLLSKAKDNNASCAIGPFIRLFNEDFNLKDVKNAEISITISGSDGFHHEENIFMKQISRDPQELVSQCINKNHNYPDGLMLFLGTMFSPIMDRDLPDKGFTHKIGDIVTIQNSDLGSLVNKVNYCHQCEPWIFGSSMLFRNLASRGLLWE